MMNVLAISLPSLMVLVGILLNQNGLNRLETRMGGLEGWLDARITALEVSLRSEMAALESSLRGEMAALGSSLRGEMAAMRADMNSLRASFHADVVMLVERDSRLETRVAQLERAS